MITLTTPDGTLLPYGKCLPDDSLNVLLFYDTLLPYDALFLCNILLPHNIFNPTVSSNSRVKGRCYYSCSRILLQVSKYDTISFSILDLMLRQV